MTEAEWFTAEQPNSLWQYVRTWASERKCRLFACACVRRLEGFIREDRLRHALRFAENATDSPPSTEDRSRAAAEAANGCVVAAGVIDTFCPNEGDYALWFLPSDEQRRLEEAYQSACRAAEEIPAPLPAVLSAEVAVAAYLAAFGDLRGAEGGALLSWADGGGQRAKDVDALWGLDEDAAEAIAKLALLRDIFGNPFRPAAILPEWRIDTALILARQMYESRDFSALPILADALQDAGCDSADVLDHCRCRDPQQVHVRGCWVVDAVLNKG